MNRKLFKIWRVGIAVMFALFVSMPAFADHGVTLPKAGVLPSSSFLYFFDRLAENVRLLITFNLSSESSLRAQFAAERLSEIQTMIANNESLDEIKKGLEEF